MVVIFLCLLSVPTLIMEAADLLCDSLFHWLENRLECAEKLFELAQQLENVHQGSNIAKFVGAAASVGSVTGAAVFTFLTGGLALPLLAVAAGSTSAGAAVSVTSELVEAGISRKNINKATELIKEDEKVGTSIQKQLRDLKDRCGGTQLGDHADELECEVTSQLMCALARRDNTHVPLDFLRGFNRATFYRHMTPGGLDPAKASRFICRALDLISSPKITSSLKVSAEEMMENIGQIGIKAAVEAGSRVLGAIGLGICLYDLIVTSEALVKGNRVAEASSLLRDSAREILEDQQKLKEQLNAMRKVIQKLFQMKNLIKDLGEYPLCFNEHGKKVIDYIKGTCRDDTVLSWLDRVTHDSEFLKLLGFVKEKLGSNLEDLTRHGESHIDIVFVGHGRIVDHFMPAGGLVPAPNIRDTILYSPWNCEIDPDAAYGIAQGLIKVTNREFQNMAGYEPDPLPDRWNSMQRSLCDIPGILLAPVTPKEKAWDLFKSNMNESMEISDRVIISYAPNVMADTFGEIPLYMFIFVTSFILMLSGKTATVHLVACLGRAGSPEKPAEWRRQYAYTSDGTVMSMKMDHSLNLSKSMLYRALRLMFDRDRR